MRFEIKIKQIDNDINILKGKEKLQKLGIYQDVMELFELNSMELLKYSFKSNEGEMYIIKLISINNRHFKYHVIKKKMYSIKKNKYIKVNMKKKMMVKIVGDIGFKEAQMYHSKDEMVERFVPLKKYLKENNEEFTEIKVYYKDFNDRFKKHRFKNLFSKHSDEISDFEKITFIERNDNKKIQVRFKLDENIHEYDYYSSSLQERKEARDFAKDVYNNKGIYTDKELLEILSSKDVYIKIYDVIPKEHKNIWSKVLFEDMDIKTLKIARKEITKERITKNASSLKKKKYISKKDLRKKKRRQYYKEINLGLEEYYDNRSII